jgi:hypothetical protein
MLGGLQRLRPWLLCLFLITQIGGVIPSVYVGTVHEYGHSETIVAPMVQAAPKVHGPAHQHKPGVHDEHDQCCALHHGLVGMLPTLSYQVATASLDLVFYNAWTAPAGEHPVRIDRPPRA